MILAKSPERGLIFDIQRYSIHDGPGIRSVVFFKGCPLKCKWCSNPESQSGQIEIMHFFSKCVMCKKCVAVCPMNAITAPHDSICIDRSKCNYCGKCIDVCNVDAWRFAGRWYTVDELLDEVLKDEIFYKSSGGGVTIGGGEPFYQYDFLKPFLAKCRDRGLHTTIETCGYVTSDKMEEVLELVDIVLMDLKHINDTKHIKATGVSNKQILANWSLAGRKKKNLICRVPVLPGFNDTAQEILDIAAYIQKVGCTEIHLLPYHQYGKGKYSALGREYMFKGDSLMNSNIIIQFSSMLQVKGLAVQIGG